MQICIYSLVSRRIAYLYMYAVDICGNIKTKTTFRYNFILIYARNKNKKKIYDNMTSLAFANDYYFTYNCSTFVIFALDVYI